MCPQRSGWFTYVVARYLTAAPEHGVEIAHQWDPQRSGAPRVVVGIARAQLLVYEPGDHGCEGLPTIAQMLLNQVDPATGLLMIYGATADVRLPMDPGPLRDLPPDLRVSHGYMFTPHAPRRW